MKSLLFKSALLTSLSAVIMSFSFKPGGEGFEVFTGSTLAVQQFGNSGSVQNVSLNLQDSGNDLFIKYYHCGKAGRNRVITVKDSQNGLLKAYRYDDSPSANSVMKLPASELSAITSGRVHQVKLYYSSSELPNGRLLVTVSL